MSGCYRTNSLFRYANIVSKSLKQNKSHSNKSIIITIIHCVYTPGSSTKHSYVVPVVVVTIVVLIFAAVLLAYFLRVRRQRNGRMKLTDQHAERLPHPYPEEKTFENPLYQVMKGRTYDNEIYR